MLVGAGEVKSFIAIGTVIPCQGIRNDHCIRAAQMRFGIDIIERRRDVNSIHQVFQRRGATDPRAPSGGSRFFESAVMLRSSLTTTRIDHPPQIPADCSSDLRQHVKINNFDPCVSDSEALVNHDTRVPPIPETSASPHDFRPALRPCLRRPGNLPAVNKTSIFIQSSLFSISFSVSILLTAPKLPIAKAARNSACSLVLLLWEIKKLTISCRGNGAKEKAKARERTVGSRPPALDAIRINTQPCGGSSNVFSNAFCAGQFIKVAGSIIATFWRPEKDRRLSAFSSSRTC